MKLADQLKSLSMKGSPAYRAGELLQELETYVEAALQLKTEEAQRWPYGNLENVIAEDRALLDKLREGANF